jgi:subtilisin family serine protease
LSSASSKIIRGLARTNVHGTYNPNYHNSYSYSSTTAGASGDTSRGRVDIYIVDTGVYCDHQDFVGKPGGSCVLGVDVVDGSHTDGNGHGSHVAGIAGGAVYGVAKFANLIAVRVLDRYCE